jgi:O-antigen chain-terminating methyltransferase
VISGDAIAYLQNQPDNSLGAITGFHIVEHLPFRVLIELLDQAHRTLMPGGAILFETPNPECLIVGACNFYYDPTHQNPLPPELMRFLAEARTFSSARVIRLDQDCDLDKPESGFMPVDVNSWFQMPMDYALYALKA